MGSRYLGVCVCATVLVKVTDAGLKALLAAVKANKKSPLKIMPMLIAKGPLALGHPEHTSNQTEDEFESNWSKSNQ